MNKKAAPNFWLISRHLNIHGNTNVAAGEQKENRVEFLTLNDTANYHLSCLNFPLSPPLKFNPPTLPFLPFSYLRDEANLHFLTCTCTHPTFPEKSRKCQFCCVENSWRQIHNLSLDSWYKVALKNLPYSTVRPEVKRTLQFRLNYGRINGNSPRPNKRGKRGRDDIFGEKSKFMLCCHWSFYFCVCIKTAGVLQPLAHAIPSPSQKRHPISTFFKHFWGSYRTRNH